MPKTVEIEIVRPVNPVGISFIRYLWGAMAARDRAVLEQWRKEFGKLVQKLGFAIIDYVEQKYGIKSEKVFVTGKVVIELDENDKPIKAWTEELKVWEATKEVKDKIEVTA